MQVLAVVEFLPFSQLHVAPGMFQVVVTRSHAARTGSTPLSRAVASVDRRDLQSSSARGERSMSEAPKKGGRDRLGVPAGIRAPGRLFEIFPNRRRTGRSANSLLIQIGWSSGQTAGLSLAGSQG